MSAFPLGSPGNTKVVQLGPAKAAAALALLGAAGIAVTYFFGIPMVKNSLMSRSWPSTEGTVTVSHFVSNTDSSNNNVTYSADIAYDYRVNGVSYTGSTVSFGQYGSSDPAHAREIVNTYPLGRPVKVYYDPASPRTSVLEPGATWSSFIVAGIGGLFAIVGFFGAFFNIKKLRSGKTGPSQPAVVA